jgi:hypothetical protein
MDTKGLCYKKKSDADKKLNNFAWETKPAHALKSRGYITG